MTPILVVTVLRQLLEVIIRFLRNGLMSIALKYGKQSTLVSAKISDF